MNGADGQEVKSVDSPHLEDWWDMAGSDAKKEAQAKKEKVPKDDSPVASAGRRKKTVILGLAGLFLLSLAGGGYFLYRTFFGGPAKQLSAKPQPQGDEHSDKKDGTVSGASKETPKDAKKSGKDSGKSDQPAHADGAGSKNDAKGADPQKETSAAKKTESKETPKEEPGKEAEGLGPDGNPLPPKKETPKKSESKTAFGTTWAVPRLDINLGNALENRFLRLSLSLEFKGGNSQKEELQMREPQIKDIIITTVGTRGRLELLNPKGKEKLRRDLLNRFNEVLERPVLNVYFSEFLVE
jgi:flagellar basal body-associated protein FliL